jgi:hypothetical protein
LSASFGIAKSAMNRFHRTGKLDHQ